MAEDFEWGGPRNRETVRGLVDGVAKELSEYKTAKGNDRYQFHFWLMDAVVQFTDGECEEHEAYELFVGTGGKPGTVFYASAVKALGKELKYKLRPVDFVGKIMVVEESKSAFKQADGGTGEMRILRVVSLDEPEILNVDESTLVGELVGLTPGEVMKNVQPKYRASEFGTALRSRAGTLKQFPQLSVVDGVYVCADASVANS